MAMTRLSGLMVSSNTITSDRIANGTIGSADLNANVSLTTSNVPTITAITYPDGATAANTSGGQTIIFTGSKYATGAYVVIDGVVVDQVTVANSSTLSFTSPAKAAGSYAVFVVNSDGTACISLPGIQYSGTPTWTTSAGSVGLLYEYQTVNVDLSATGDGTLAYTIASGSLPSGITLASNGHLSGTLGAIASTATYNFTVNATDSENQVTARAFSLTVNPDAITWTTPSSNNTTYQIYPSIAISNVVLSATSSGGFNVAYSVNTLPAGLTLSGSTISGTPTALGNTSTVITANVATSGRSSTRNVVWQSIPGFTATGGNTITTINGYKYHIFSSSGTFSVTFGTRACDILIVGGGGAGCGTDGNGSGGGGAGGYLEKTAYSLGVGDYAITIGAGGTASTEAGANGSPTTFSTLFTALGGGGGGGRYPNEGGGTSQYGSNGRAGGSGGGGGFGHPGGSALQPTSASGGYGNKGGDTTYLYSSSTGTPGGGGGGAGAAGQNAQAVSPYTTPGNGGNGKQWVDGNYYAGGGGGATGEAVTQGTGGLGGGANGIRAATGLAGTNNTGGGGGGVGGASVSGGAGGSGIIIVRYAV